MIDQEVFNTIFGAIEYTKEDTAAHYQGEVEKLHNEQYNALIQCWNRRPDLTEAEIVHIVERHRNEKILKGALDQFRDVVESFKKAARGEKIVKTKQFRLWVDREFGRVFYSISSPDLTDIGNRVDLGIIEIQIDEEEVQTKLEGYDAAAKEAKRAKLLAELAKLDGKESAA